MCRTERYEIPRGQRLRGLCYDDNRLYCVEHWTTESSLFYLTLYEIGAHELNLLDTVALGHDLWYCRPRGYTQTHVILPCREGVRVYHYDDRHLVVARELKCVREAWGVAVKDMDSVFVCDSDSKCVCLVNMDTDTITRRLQKPRQVRNEIPWHLAVLKDTVLVCYGENALVTYSNYGRASGHVIETISELVQVSSVTTDNHSNFLVTEYGSGCVFVIDERGKLQTKVDSKNWGLRDCGVAQSQLWLGYDDGHIDVMTSE